MNISDKATSGYMYKYSVQYAQVVYSLNLFFGIE